MSPGPFKPKVSKRALWTVTFTSSLSNCFCLPTALLVVSPSKPKVARPSLQTTLRPASSCPEWHCAMFLSHVTWVSARTNAEQQTFSVPPSFLQNNLQGSLRYPDQYRRLPVLPVLPPASSPELVWPLLCNHIWVSTFRLLSLCKLTFPLCLCCSVAAAPN